MPVGRCAEFRHVTHSAHAPKAAACLNKRGADPAQQHLAVAPALDVARLVADCAVRVLYGMGAAQRQLQRTVDAQARHGECFFQPFAQRAGGAGMLALERARQALQ